MNKWLPAIAFAVLLLVPVGAQDAFSSFRHGPNGPSTEVEIVFNPSTNRWEFIPPNFLHESYEGPFLKHIALRVPLNEDELTNLHEELRIRAEPNFFSDWHENFQGVSANDYDWGMVNMGLDTNNDPSSIEIPLVIDSVAQGNNQIVITDDSIDAFFNPSIDGTLIIDKEIICKNPTTTCVNDIFIVEYPSAIDYGDLPAPYKTTKTHVPPGPNHDIITTLGIGMHTDSESDGQPTGDADGDDSSGRVPDDEDGVTLDTLIVGETPEVHVVVFIGSTFVSDHNPEVFIWIDKDGIGPLTLADRFGPFPAVNGNNDYSVNLSGYTAGESAMRVRICTDLTTCDTPTGHATDGEVEDYKVFIMQGPVVGGSIIPIDTTSLLLAGTQMTASWMIPVIVAGIGFAIVIARKF